MGPGAGLGERLEICFLSEVWVRTGTYKPSKPGPSRAREGNVDSEGRRGEGAEEGREGTGGGQGWHSPRLLTLSLCLSYLLLGKLPEG